LAGNELAAAEAAATGARAACQIHELEESAAV